MLGGGTLYWDGLSNGRWGRGWAGLGWPAGLRNPGDGLIWHGCEWPPGVAILNWGSANGAAGPVGVAGLTEWDVATGKSWLAGSCANWGLCRVWAWSVHLARSQLKW